MLRVKRLPTTIAFVAASFTSGLINILPSFAQTLSPCAPPAVGEFILLVSTPTTASETQLKQVLPPTVSIPICDYQGNRVSRMGGFRNFSDANAWAEYINQAAGLPAFVAQPASTAPTATPTPVPQVPVARPATPTFTPQPLGTGFAVIVDFLNTPAIAAQLRATQSRTPGLVSYGRQAYLLASYTTDSSAALTTLQQLTQQGFQTFIVDSRQVMLLTDAVQIR
ncbi:MAG: hypothetical protein ACO3NK_09575 [Prochlorotrichaceae cyanobacterium]|jgi:hypothetical protein